MKYWYLTEPEYDVQPCEVQRKYHWCECKHVYCLTSKYRDCSYSKILYCRAESDVL